MPALHTTVQEKAPDLACALGSAGEKEYRRLLRVMRRALGSLFLFPIESDFTPALRNALLMRLGEDLATDGYHLRIVTLTRQQWDLFTLLEMATPISETDVVALIGLEETPGIVPEAGLPPSRPPALALLNQQRETLHRCIPAPLLVWCPPFAYIALIEHAPDFFDYYSGQFQFMNAAPEMPILEIFGDTTAIEAENRVPAQNRPLASRANLEFYEELVRRYTQLSPKRARALIGLADALWSLKSGDYLAQLTRARDCVEEALGLLSPEQTPYDWARGQNLLGTILYGLSEGNRIAVLQRSIACYEAALQVYTEQDFPYEWATTQNSLGTAYQYLPIGDHADNLQRAIACYEAALRVSTETNFPMQWAAIQYNLGIAYVSLPSGDRSQNLLHAIACFEAVLRVSTEADFPMQWARTQNNLGLAYLRLPSGDRSQNLLQAITCYEAVLRVSTEADFPMQWARTQNNLGLAYLRLPSGDRSQNLLQAITCYEAALRVYAEHNFPYQRAMISFNLALAQNQVGDLDRAKQMMKQAVISFGELGVESEAQRAKDWLREWETS